LQFFDASGITVHCLEAVALYGGVVMGYKTVAEMTHNCIIWEVDLLHIPSFISVLSNVDIDLRLQQITGAAVKLLAISFSLLLLTLGILLYGHFISDMKKLRFY